MNISKKIIIVGLFILFVSGLVLFGALQQENEQINKIPQKITKPFYFPKNSKSNLPIEVEKNIKIQTAEKIPSIILELEKINENKSIEIVENLGFNKSDAKTFKDVIEGTKYLWSNNDNYLTITPNKSYIQYGIDQFPENISNKNFSDGDYNNQALDFMASKFGINKDVIKTTSISYLKISPKSEGFSETTKEEAQLYHVNLTYKDIDYPVLTSMPKLQILFVELLPNGEVYKAGAYLVDEIKKSNKSYQVKTLDEVKNTINEAHLISVENDYIYLIDVQPEDIKNIDIEKIEIGYYFDDININTTLRPIFLLEGEIEIKNSTADWAKLYIPALKQ